MLAHMPTSTLERATLKPLQTSTRVTSLGALAAGFGLLSLAGHTVAQRPTESQTPPASALTAESTPETEIPSTVLPKITVRGHAEAQGKATLNPTQTGIGKGQQDIRDVPQSVTVVTERLMDDRNLDTLKAALHNTAGVTFMAAEGGEEDIRLRGFSLAASGDIFLDGMRDPAFYERDTFNNDRIELLRGSASMLFGRGSTGGAVNQVSKQPQLIDEHEISGTLGSGHFARTTGDFNFKTGDDAAMRFNVMSNNGDQDGLKTHKKGLAAAYRRGIGTAHELQFAYYGLDNHNGINYGMPWARSGTNRLRDDQFDTTSYYGMASDYSAGAANLLTASHIHRFEGSGELKTQFREGHYKRDQRASAIRFQPTNFDPTNTTNRCQTPVTSAPGVTPVTRETAVYDDPPTDNTMLCRGSNNKIQGMVTRYLQSDYSNSFEAQGMKHDVLGGADVALEYFNNYGASAGTAKPTVNINNPDDGAWVDESARALTLNRNFKARALGLYAQDLVQVAPQWKLLGGLRWDYFSGNYWSAATTGNNAQPEVRRGRTDTVWSKRFGALFQPSPLTSFHASYGTSFNVSGDTYQYEDANAEKTAPEGSRNIELGARLDTESRRFTTRLALFHATKTNERNRDSDSATEQNLLSGKRHTAGTEIDLTGRLTKAWEVYGSYAWTPIAKIDKAAPGVTTGEITGARPSLTPKHAGTIWSTYQATSAIRVGAGLNARSTQTPNRNPAGISAPSFVTGDLMAEYALAQATLKLDVTNVTDKYYADTLYTGHYVQGAARTVKLTGTYKF